MSYWVERLPHRDPLRLDLVTVMICHVGLASHSIFFLLGVLLDCKPFSLFLAGFKATFFAHGFSFAIPAAPNDYLQARNVEEHS